MKFFINADVAARLAAGGIVLACVSGCMFDVVSLRQMPVSFSAAGVGSDSFLLNQAVSAELGTGFPTKLKDGTKWHRVGSIDAGAVFFTEGQIVKVEASNIHEARIVVSKEFLVGFYLPVERTFVPLVNPIKLDIKKD